MRNTTAPLPEDVLEQLQQLGNQSTFFSFRLPNLWLRNLKTYALADGVETSVVIREALKEWAERRNRDIGAFL